MNVELGDITEVGKRRSLMTFSDMGGQRSMNWSVVWRESPALKNSACSINASMT